MSYQPLNGNYMQPGFNSYRFTTGRFSSGVRGSMSPNGSIYMPRYNYAQGHVGTYFQMPTPEPEKFTFLDGAMAFFGGLCNSLTSNPNILMSIMSAFTGKSGDGGGGSA